MTKPERAQNLEKKIFESYRVAGANLPATLGEVASERLEHGEDDSTALLPPRLQDAQAVLEQIKSKPNHDPKVFGELINALRKSKKLSIGQLAKQARVLDAELDQIETNPAYQPKPRTVSQLAKFFKIAPKSFIGLANLSQTVDARLSEGVVRFAACSRNMNTSDREQRRAVREFVKLLNRLK